MIHKEVEEFIFKLYRSRYVYRMPNDPDNYQAIELDKTCLTLSEEEGITVEVFKHQVENTIRTLLDESLRKYKEGIHISLETRNFFYCCKCVLDTIRSCLIDKHKKEVMKELYDKSISDEYNQEKVIDYLVNIGWSIPNPTEAKCAYVPICEYPQDEEHYKLLQDLEKNADEEDCEYAYLFATMTPIAHLETHNGPENYYLTLDSRLVYTVDGVKYITPHEVTIEELNVAFSHHKGMPLTSEETIRDNVLYYCSTCKMLHTSYTFSVPCIFTTSSREGFNHIHRSQLGVDMKESTYFCPLCRGDIMPIYISVIDYEEVEKKIRIGSVNVIDVITLLPQYYRRMLLPDVVTNELKK